MEERKLLVMLLMISIMSSVLGAAVLKVSFHEKGSPLSTALKAFARPKSMVLSYKVRITDGFIMEENITYEIVKGYQTMVFRSFNTRVTAKDVNQPNFIVVKSILCPKDMRWYIRDWRGRLYTNAEGYDRERLLSILKRAGASNEVGCYSPKGLGPGDIISVSFRFMLIPKEVWSDGKNYLYVLRLASANRHIPYYNLTLLGVNTKLSTLPPLSEGSLESLIRIDHLPQNAGLDLLILTDRGAKGSLSTVPVDDINNKVNYLLKRKALYYNIAFLIPLINTTLAVLSPLIILAVYIKSGRELPPREQIPYGMPPATGEKPWEVAALYGSKPGRLSANLIASVLIDLKLRGLLEIDSSTKRVEVKDYSKMDPLEKLIASSMVRKGRGALSLLRDAEEIVSRKADEGIEANYRHIFYGVIFSILALSVLSAYIYENVVNLLPLRTLILGLVVPLLAYIPPILSPRYLLGRWRPGYRERAIAWHIFAKQVRSYSREALLRDPKLVGYAVALLGSRHLRVLASRMGLRPSYNNVSSKTL